MCLNIILYVNYDQLNVYRCSINQTHGIIVMIIGLQPTGLILVLKIIIMTIIVLCGVYSSIDKFEESNYHCQIRILCNVPCVNC